jgi:hypothetical protein
MDNITCGPQVTAMRDYAHHDEILTYLRAVEEQAGEVIETVRAQHGETGPQVQRVAERLDRWSNRPKPNIKKLSHLPAQGDCFRQVFERVGPIRKLVNFSRPSLPRALDADSFRPKSNKQYEQCYSQ